MEVNEIGNRGVRINLCNLLLITISIAVYLLAI